MILTVRNQIEFEVYGNCALFTDPLTKIGGEKMSYQIPTYQSLKGITESIYWKPTLIWVIDEVRVMNSIQTESRGIRPIEYGGGNTLTYYTYLHNPRYQVKAHFIFNSHREDLIDDRDEHKHHNIAKRAVSVGGRRDIFLDPENAKAMLNLVYMEKEQGFTMIMTEKISFGVMVHGINYPDETGKSEMETRLWKPTMNKGVITFIRPDECTLIRQTGDMSLKQFNEGNMQSVDELYEEIFSEEKR